MNFRKFSLFFITICWFLLISSCSSEVKVPVSFNTASSALDFIFNTNSVGFTTITIRRSEWNKMLSYFDYFYKNENSVIAESYEYKKDGKTWKLDNVGLRLRGNTSRFRPQGKDTAEDETGHRQMNADWSKDYYAYAATCSDNDYRQSHFKVDFEPMPGDDRKLENCMKGVALKRSDGLFSKEIFCYNLFHQYGIWTAPRASQTKVYLKFIEDVKKDGTLITNTNNCSVTTIDYGVYEMFEEVNKQSLKGRMKKNNNNLASTAWLNNDGDLWKCSGGNLTAASNTPENFGCEQIEILNTDKPKSEWSWIWHGPCYDLKTNKKSVDIASLKFQGFLTELNNLSDYDYHSEAGIQARKDFYEKWFDVDFFIKTYAVNCLVGMDDDYWGNANNYYLYFDNGKSGSGKCYLIPFDYDNTLGSSIDGDKVITNPLEWGNGNSRPLLDRLLEVPEYVEKFKKALLDVSSQDKKSPWNKNKCFSFWDKLHSQVSNYVYTSDIKGWPNISSTMINDDGGWKDQKHYLTKDSNNIYEQTTVNFRYWLKEGGSKINFDLNGGSYFGEYGVIEKEYNGVNPKLDSIIGNPVLSGYDFIGWTKTKNGSDYVSSYTGDEDFNVYASWGDVSDFSGLTIYEIKDSSFEGIKIGIYDIPEDDYRFRVYINGIEAANASKENLNKYGKIWAYPFTQAGKTYEVRVEYYNSAWGFLERSNTINITAKSGKGEFKLLNKPEFYIENNILKWKKEPVIQIGNGITIRADDNWDEYYLLEIQSTKKKDDSAQGYHESWNYQSWNRLGASCNVNFNFKNHVNPDVLDGTRFDLTFSLKYNYNTSPFGEYCIIIYDYSDVPKFNIK